MSILVPYNGSTYIIPTPNEIGWGTNLDNYLVAISNGSLQNIGGSFTLSNDADFGGTNGLKALYYKTRSSNIAGSGQFRLANAIDSVSWRNAGNTADLPLAVNSSDQLTFNGIPLAAGGSGTVFPGTQYQLAYYATSTNAVSGLPLITASKVLISDSNGLPIASSVTPTELGYLSGVTSSIQTQLNTLQSEIGSSANNSLSNLSLVAVNADLLPGITDSVNLGSTSFEWNTVHSKQFFVPSGQGYYFQSTSSITGGNTLIDFAVGATPIYFITNTGVEFHPSKALTLDTGPSGDLARLQFDDNNTSIWKGSIDANLHFNLFNGSSGIEWLTVNFSTSVAKFNTGLSIPNHSGNPSSPINGQIYWDSSDTNFYGWNGTTWKPFTHGLVNLTTDVTGVLPVANGGTNTTHKLMTNGTYAGNSTGGRLIAHGLGVTPTYIMVIETDSVNGVAPAIWSSDFPNQSGGARDTAGTYATTYITAADATNFTLGASAVVNGSTRFYQWIAWASQ